MSAKQVSIHYDVFISIPYYLLIKVTIKSCDSDCIIPITSQFIKGTCLTIILLQNANNIRTENYNKESLS